MALGAPTTSMARAGFNIKLDQAQWTRAQLLLTEVKDGARRVLMRSINKTIAGVKTDTISEIRKNVNVTAKAIRQTMSDDKATLSKLTARVTSSQEYGTSLAAFGARQTTKGVTVQVLKRRSRSLIPHAFILRKRGGNVVFWRTKKEWVGKGKRPWVRSQWVSTGRSGGASQVVPFYGALPDKYRLPIEKLWGPAVPDLMKHAPTLKAIEKKAVVRLDKNLQHELNYLLGRL